MTLAGAAEWGLQTGLVVSFLIVGVLIIRRPFARYFGASAAYALWLLPAIRLFMPTITVPFITRPVSPITMSPDMPEAMVQTEPAAKVVSGDLFSLPLQTEAVIDPSMSVDTNFVTELSIWTLGAIIWLSLAVLWFGFQLLQQRAFMRRMRLASYPTGDNLAAPIAYALQSLGLKRRPDIRLSEAVSGPMVTGVLRPLILLPHDFETRFNADQQIFALVHEMAHIKRGDLWVAYATLLFRAVFWPNPLVHYAANKMRIDQEAACDAAVVAKTGGESAAHSYAETLVHAAKSAHGMGHKAPLGLALSETDIEMVNHQGDRK